MHRSTVNLVSVVKFYLNCSFKILYFLFVVDPGVYKKEYRPNWGFMSFLADFLRPFPYEGSWYTLLKKGGGGCNDLLYSGHMLVAVLTAMAWTVCIDSQLIPSYII